MPKSVSGEAGLASSAGKSTLASRIEKSLLLRIVLSVTGGALLAFSFPDVSAGPLVFIGLAPLIIAVVLSRSLTEAFFQATGGTMVTWLINLPWVIKVMSYYGGLAYPVAVAIYIALALALGVFAGVFFGLPVRALRLGARPLPWMLVPAAWVAVELARTYLLSGFPWHQLAAAIIDLTPLVQLTSIIGPYGVGFFIAVPSTFIAWALISRPPRREVILSASAVVMMLVVWTGWGMWAVRVQDSRIEAEAKSRAALLQPNISQEMRWGASSVAELFIRMEEMTIDAIRQGADVVVWPESTIPLTYARTDVFRESVESASRGGIVGRDGTATPPADIILGSVAEDPEDPSKLWNAAYLVSGGKTAGRYDKIRLVPFGEYVPLKEMLFFAEKLVRAVGDFQFGENENPLQGTFRYGPAICYEVVYPQITRTQILNGAEVLVTITNDGWFGGTAAPRQHLNMARLRAVEGDRYLLRAATTGISALVDPAGRLVQSLDENRQGTLMVEFSPRKTMTMYMRIGDSLAFVSVAALVLALALKMRRRVSS